MKARYTTVDIVAAISEIKNSSSIGLRVANVYDIDNKTFLVRLTHGEIKSTILVESGNRIHLTEYDWPKSMMPSGFSMKCRKHLKGRRLASINQLGVDRIVDMTFGYDEAAYHLIVELYDRGNIVLADFEYNILQLLRVRTDENADVKFAVREKYPVELARKEEPLLSINKLEEIIKSGKSTDSLKQVLNPLLIFGPSLLEHCLLEGGFSPSTKLSQINTSDKQEISKLYSSLQIGDNILKNISSKEGEGYLIQKKESNANAVGEKDLLIYTEFHPFLYHQHKSLPFIHFHSFNKCVDEFFSKLESQKIDLKALQQEKAALKRLENVREDHEKRIHSLKETQDKEARRAKLIELNLPLIERAIIIVNSAIANQLDWEEIEDLLKEAKLKGDPVANIIKSLQLKTNQITISVNNISDEEETESDEDDLDEGERKKQNKKSRKQKKVDIIIDLGLTAFGNARSLHDKRRNAATKEEKTIQASKKALKSAEYKTKETLKEVQNAKIINKTRKTFWFEKFYWFISSENYLVIGGRDQQQNEILVKRYLKAGDLYVHADLHGASSVIIKNSTGLDVPPKTLNEAGTMAICYSAAWEARVITSAWWVYHNQVSKTAPSGEYLTTGSFMIRGKKNFLPPSYLIMGFSVLFKLDESCISRHVNDRRVKSNDDQENKSIEVEDFESKQLNNELESESDDSSSKEDIQTEESMEMKADKMSNLENEELVNEMGNIIDKIIKIDTGKQEGDTGKQEEDTGKIKSDSEDFENAFPDTNIQLYHVSGGKFELHPEKSGKLNTNTANNTIKSENDQITQQQKSLMQQQNRKPRISAKQRRDLKKKVKQNDNEDNDTVPESSNNIKEKLESTTKNKVPANKSVAEVKTCDPPKRGAKAKLKKINEKYKDQDEEDRQLFQEIIRSNEPARPPKKTGKNKIKEKNTKQVQQQKREVKKNTVETIIIEQPEGDQSLTNNIIANDEEPDEEIEKENITIIDSLTGCPLEDDILLHAIPLCAPYSSLQNYKFKVKLTPGTGKRGKAAISSLHSFLMTKGISDWEKDLLKCLKDSDISRNLPGKVKVSGPNLHKVKKK
ncbi:ribosome quality control complex subunit NEMF isoform X1 [Hydra vulgaris]|nr:ribosome quality control complex subunit NEMF [Hydra vulgaris]